MPRADGQPLIAELIAPMLLEEAGLPHSRADAVVFVSALRDRLLDVPSEEQMREALGIARDPREDKPWPPEEDCAGCDQRKSGQHRFGCSVHGARQMRLSVRKAER